MVKFETSDVQTSRDKLSVDTANSSTMFADVLRDADHSKFPSSANFYNAVKRVFSGASIDFPIQLGSSHVDFVLPGSSLYVTGYDFRNSACVARALRQLVIMGSTNPDVLAYTPFTVPQLSREERSFKSLESLILLHADELQLPKVSVQKHPWFCFAMNRYADIYDPTDQLCNIDKVIPLHPAFMMFGLTIADMSVSDYYGFAVQIRSKVLSFMTDMLLTPISAKPKKYVSWQQVVEAILGFSIAGKVSALEIIFLSSSAALLTGQAKSSQLKYAMLGDSLLKTAFIMDAYMRRDVTPEQISEILTTVLTNANMSKVFATSQFAPFMSCVNATLTGKTGATLLEANACFIYKMGGFVALTKFCRFVNLHNFDDHFVSDQQKFDTYQTMQLVSDEIRDLNVQI